MRVFEHVGPLPDVADQVHHTERAYALGMSGHVIRAGQIPSLVWFWNGRVAPGVSPRVAASIAALRGVLPFPLVRQTFTSPLGESLRVFYGHPGDGLVVPARRRGTVPPIAEEVVIIDGMILRRVEELF